MRRHVNSSQPGGSPPPAFACEPTSPRAEGHATPGIIRDRRRWFVRDYLEQIIYLPLTRQNILFVDPYRNFGRPMFGSTATRSNPSFGMPLPSPPVTAWLADATSQDLVILTRDGNLYVNEHERLALERYRHRVFWIGPKKGTGQDWADTSEAHHQAIVRYARQPGPFVVEVQQGGLQRAWP